MNSLGAAALGWLLAPWSAMAEIRAAASFTRSTDAVALGLVALVFDHRRRSV